MLPLILKIPIENAIRQRLIPAITGKSSISDIDREIFALPTRLGGLNIQSPINVSDTDSEYEASTRVTKPLVDLIYHQFKQYMFETFDQPSQIKSHDQLKKEKCTTHLAVVEQVMSKLTQTQQRSIKVASEKGASSWLVALPIEKHGFSLHKSAF